MADIIARGLANRNDLAKSQLQEPLEDLVTMYETISFPYGKGLVAFRFDDNDQSFYTYAYPELKSRGFVATNSFVADRVGFNDTKPKCTDAQTKEMCQLGFELASHSLNHLDTPKTRNEMLDEVVNSKAIWESAIGFKVRDFVLPGTWNDRPTADTELGHILKQNYTFYEGYSGSPITKRPMKGRYGLNHQTMDDMTSAQIQPWIDQVAGKNKAVILLAHNVGAGYSGGVALAEFIKLLDYIKVKRDAGLLEVVTDSGLMAARVGEPYNHIFNGKFEFGFEGYTVTGNPTLTVDGSDNVVNVTNADFIRYTLDTENAGGIYRISYEHSTATTGQARFILLYPNGAGNTTYTIAKPSTTSWQTIETCIQVPIDGTLPTFWLQPPSSNASPIKCKNLKLTRIG